MWLNLSLRAYHYLPTGTWGPLTTETASHKPHITTCTSMFWFFFSPLQSTLFLPPFPFIPLRGWRESLPQGSLQTAEKETKNISFVLTIGHQYTLAWNNKYESPFESAVAETLHGLSTIHNPQVCHDQWLLQAVMSPPQWSRTVYRCKMTPIFSPYLTRKLAISWVISDTLLRYLTSTSHHSRTVWVKAKGILQFLHLFQKTTRPRFDCLVMKWCPTVQWKTTDFAITRQFFLGQASTMNCYTFILFSLSHYFIWRSTCLQK